MIKILIEGEWVEGIPSEGETKRIYDSAGGYVACLHTDVVQEVTPVLLTSISRREFWQRVGDVKYAELLTLAETDNLLKARIDIINADQNVWLLSPEYMAWFAELVESELITQDEYGLIFEIKGE